MVGILIGAVGAVTGREVGGGLGTVGWTDGFLVSAIGSVFGCCSSCYTLGYSISSSIGKLEIMVVLDISLSLKISITMDARPLCDRLWLCKNSTLVLFLSHCA